MRFNRLEESVQSFYKIYFEKVDLVIWKRWTQLWTKWSNRQQALHSSPGIYQVCKLSHSKMYSIICYKGEEEKEEKEEKI